jgi:hypothetical protein
MESIDNEYAEFIENLNIYSLNEEIKKIQRINEGGGKRGWSTLQKKEYISLLAYMNEKYPLKNVTTYTKEKNHEIRKPRFKEYEKKVAIENRKYKIYKDAYIQIINKRKQILMNETKSKEKQKASEDIICECGLLSKRKHISTHRKTANHIKLMNICKETFIAEKVQVCSEIQKPNLISQKEAKIIDEDFEKILKDENINDSDSDLDDEDFITQKPFTEYQIKQFRLQYKLSEDYNLLINKNYEYRKKWVISDDELRPSYKKENGLTIMPLIVVGIH